MPDEILVKLVSAHYHFQVQTTTMPSERAIAEMVIQLGRAACCDYPGGLSPAQWTALRYFSRANRFSRTVSAFAAFHHTTKGTASQTVKSLVSRGFLTRTQSDRDGRSAIMDLTAAGRAFLVQDPLKALIDAVGRLPHRQRGDMAAALTLVLEDLSCAQGKRQFGMCTACSFLCTSEAGQRSVYTCRLVGELLEWEETRQICVNFCSRQPEGVGEMTNAKGERIEAQP